MEAGSVDSVLEAQVRAYLARILAAPDFARAKQLRLLLEFLVLRTLSGFSSEIKEATIASAVFNRDGSFNSADDNIVRVEIGRLRKRLEQYYQREGWLDGIRIDIPKGTYVPSFKEQTVHEAGLGCILGEHKITTLLSRSLDGTLFLALNPHTFREVLLWLTDPLADPHSVFVSARQAALVAHPAICSPQDIGLVTNRVFMVFGAPRGELLSERLKKGPLPEDQAFALLRSVSEGVGSLHEAGLVCGWLRPECVMLPASGEESATLLLLAAEPRTRSDDTGRSPEQRRGLVADQRSDVWAIGSMMRMSLPAQSLQSASFLREVTERCIQISPAQRFASAGDLSATLAGITELAPPGRAPLGKSNAATAQMFRRVPWSTVLFVSIAILLGAGFVWSRSRPAPPPKAIRIAVLPFVGLGTDGDSIAAARTIPELVALSLSNTPGIEIVSLRSLPRLQPGELPLARIGTEFGAGYAVEGSVAKAGDDYTLILKLARTEDLSYRWTGTYRGNSTSIYAMESRASSDIARILGVVNPATGPDWKASTRNPRAFEAWSRAHQFTLDYLNNLYLKPKEDVERELLRAVELDPNFTAPMVDLGLINWMAAFPPAPKQTQEIAAAENWFRVALARVPNHPLAQASLGRAVFFRGDRLAGVRLIEQGVRTDKSDPYVLFALSDAYWGMGYWESALAELDAMIKADPLLNLGYDHKAQLFASLFRFDEAIHAVESLPINSPRRLINLVGLYLKMGRVSEAERALQQLKNSPAPMTAPLLTANVAAARGDLAPSKRFAQIEGIRVTDDMLILDANLGDERKLLATIPKHPLQNNYRWMIGLPQLRQFAADPEFQAAVREQYRAWQEGLAEFGASLPVHPPPLPSPDEYFQSAAAGSR